MSNLEQTDDAIEHLQICYRFWHQFTPLSFFLKGEIHRANVTVFSVPGLCMDSLRAYNYKKRRKVSPHTRQILIKSIQKKSSQRKCCAFYCGCSSFAQSESVFRMKTPADCAVV